jgi:hypothetical protein
LHWAHRLEGEVYACELAYKLERGRIKLVRGGAPKLGAHQGLRRAHSSIARAFTSRQPFKAKGKASKGRRHTKAKGVLV